MAVAVAASADARLFQPAPATLFTRTDSVVQNADDASLVQDTLQGGGHAAASSNGRLSAILNEIGASEFLQNFIDDDQDDDCIASYKIPNRVRKSYGLPQHLAASFVEKCRLSVGAQRSAAASNSDFPSTSTTTSSATSSPAPPLAATPVDAASLLRKLNLEMVGELGKGGFGTVYKCKDALQKRFVAVKLVNDAKNAQAAMREGQKLLRAKHKNIVQVHRVLDLNPILGYVSCALEMEVVAGGDLSEPLEAARRRPEQRLPPAAVQRFSRQLLDALVYLHGRMKWLHGDIKPQNMLLQCQPLPGSGSAIDYAAHVTVCLTAPACCDRACEQACTRWRERCVPSLQPRLP